MASTRSFIAFEERREIALLKGVSPRLPNETALALLLVLVLLVLGDLLTAPLSGTEALEWLGSLPDLFTFAFVVGLSVLMTRAFELQRSLPGAPLRLLWRAMEWPFRALGLISDDWRPVWVERRMMVPVEVTIDLEADAPELRWQWRRDRVHVLEDSPVEAPNVPLPPVDLDRERGQIEIKGGKIAIDLNRNLDGAVLLELRHANAGARLILQLDDPAWISPEALAELPLIDRQGPAIEGAEADALLDALTIAAQLQGIALPHPLARRAALASAIPRTRLPEQAHAQSEVEVNEAVNAR